jgi:hypothetical protein
MINNYVMMCGVMPVNVTVTNKTTTPKRNANSVIAYLENHSSTHNEVPMGYVAVNELFNKKGTYGLNEIGQTRFDNWLTIHNPQFVKVKNQRGTWTYYSNVNIK